MLASHEVDISVCVVSEVDLSFFGDGQVSCDANGVAQVPGVCVLGGAVRAVFQHFDEVERVEVVSAIMSSRHNWHCNMFRFVGEVFMDADLIGIDIAPDASFGADDVDISSAAFSDAVES